MIVSSRTLSKWAAVHRQRVLLLPQRQQQQHSFGGKRYLGLLQQSAAGTKHIHAGSRNSGPSNICFPITIRHREMSSLTAWVEEHVWQRPNPFLEYIESSLLATKSEKGEEKIHNNNIDTTPAVILPPWDRMQPHHSNKATTKVIQEYEQNLQSLSSSLNNYEDLRAAWTTVQLPVTFYQQALSVLALAADPPAVQVQWQAAHAQFTHEATRVWQQTVVQDPNAAVAQSFGSVAGFDSNSSSDTATNPQEERWLRFWQEQTGANSSNNRDDWIRWQTALHDIRSSWMDVKPSQSRTWLPLVYSYIGSRQALARDVYGYDHAGAHALALRHAEPSHIPALHQHVSEKIVPHIMLATEQPFDPRIKPLTKERNVSLEAVMVVLQQLFADVFGFQLTYSNDPAQAWHPDVRQIQIMSTDGSTTTTVYLDLFARPGKANLAATIPVAPGITVLSLNLEAPVWDTDPVLMSWENLLDLFHEMGHVLQQHAQQPSLVDPSWPIDWAEVLPKVRYK